ncbi:MAG: LysE family translocator [Pseudomonadota bacterium]
MDIHSLALFGGALFVAAGSPGPSLAALVARVLTNGWRDVLPFVAAMWIGEAIWLGVTLAGLAALTETFHLAFVLLKYAGAAYLLYLAYQMWTAPTDIRGQSAAPRRNSPWKMFLAGMTVTLGNPKIMVFYLALLPTLIDMTAVGIGDWAALTAVMVGVLAVIDLGYVLAAARARRFIRSPKAMGVANRVSAAAMGGAAGLIVARS